MNNTRPKQITTHHLERRAIVYRRSAVYSPASLDRQITQRDFALSWGWPIDAIEIIDDEGPSSGLDASRAGYQRLRRMIQEGQVGLVLAADLSCLSRSHSEVRSFFDLCLLAATLLAANGTIVVLDENEQLRDQLLQCVAAFERRRRTRRHRTRQRPAANKRSNGNQS